VPINGVQTALNLCAPENAPVGQVAFTDGAPTGAMTVSGNFPYLNPPLRGSPRPQDRP
jgi:hypothetical protein